MIHPPALTEVFQSPDTGSQVKWFSATEGVEPPSSFSLYWKGIVHDLTIEIPVRKIGQSDERVVRDFCRGRICPAHL